VTGLEFGPPNWGVWSAADTALNQMQSLLALPPLKGYCAAEILLQVYILKYGH